MIRRICIRCRAVYRDHVASVFRVCPGCRGIGGRCQNGGDRKGEKSKVQNELLIGETAKRIAEEHGVSAATIRRDAEFAKAVDTLPPKEKEEVLSGKSGKSKEGRHSN